MELDNAMARACVEVGTERHVGRLREHHLPTGFCYLQEGKDLTPVAHIVGTGGIFRVTQAARTIFSGARSDAGPAFLLKPTQPRMWIDRDYVMWAVGLLAESAPDAAFALLRRYLVEVT